MPPRFAFGKGEAAAFGEVLGYYRARGQDPGYQGHFEAAYCAAFAAMMGGGYADAVATGTASIYIALAALDLPKGSNVLVSSITDPGSISPIILLGLTPKLIDAMPDDYNIGADQVEARIDERTSCVLAVHATGRANQIAEIQAVCEKHDLKLLEDCSQAHGARYGGTPVGAFGDIAAFSTMFSKNSIAGSTGGVVFTRDLDLHRAALAHADRGKPTWEENFDPRDPSSSLFPALNFHTDEFSCAVGEASLQRLDDTIERRRAYFRGLSERLARESDTCRTVPYSDECSPFIIPVFVDTGRLSCSKRAFADAVREEGIGLNPHYNYLVQDWPWVRPYLADEFDCKNAASARDASFCLYVNEKYGTQEADDTVNAILKVENHFRV